jgi:bifunctional NMN adenylyltransferase/nudix hydrolase
LVGCDRDDTTWYLNKFPEYKKDLIEQNHRVSRNLNATSIREIYFGNTWNGKELSDNEIDILMRAFIPPTTLAFLDEWKKTETYKNLREWHFQNVDYMKPYKGLPFGIIFHTADAIVVQNGYILLVKRKFQPGRGLWALPGGHVKNRQLIEDAAISELNEETNINIADHILRKSIKHEKNFDAIDRSMRGRTITTGFLFGLDDAPRNNRLPLVKAGDDAEEAKWVELAWVKNNSRIFFEDHFHIQEYMVARLDK